MAQRLTNLTSIHEDTSSTPSLGTFMCRGSGPRSSKKKDKKLKK